MKTRGEEEAYDSVFVPTPDKFPGGKRLASVLYFFLAPFAVLFGRKACNVILTQPPLFFILAASLSKLRGEKFIIHVMDVYPDLFALGSRFGKAIDWLFSRNAVNAYQSADRVIVIGECMKQRLLNKGVVEARIEVIRNWADESIRPDSESGKEFRLEQGLVEKFIVMYSGNIGFAHDIHQILLAASELEHVQEIHFVFVGSGVRRHEVEEHIRKGAPNVVLLESAPREALCETLCAADIHLISLRSGFEGLVVPSKFYGIIAAGKPAVYLGSEHSEVAQAIGTHDCGVVVEPATSFGLVAAIQAYFEHDELVKAHGKNALRASEQIFSRETSVDLYSDLLENTARGNIDL